MLGKRELSQYKHSTMPNPAPVHLHRTFTPLIDELDRCEIEIRSNSAQAHMSTTCFLERTYRCQERIIDADAEFFDLDVDKYTIPVHTDTGYAVTPGFAIHEHMTNFNIQYKASHDEDKNPRQWVNTYSKLYYNDLCNLMRGSGRNLPNMRDHEYITNCLYYMPTQNIQNPDNIERWVNGGDANELIQYPMPDRIE